MTTKTDIGFWDGISYHLARKCVIIAVSIGLLISILQIFLDREKVGITFVKTVHEVIETNYDSTLFSVYNFDQEDTKEVVIGLMKYRPIISVTVDSYQGEGLGYAEHRDPAPRNWLENLLVHKPVTIQRELIFHGKQDRPIGKITVIADPAITAGDFLRRAMMFIMSGIVRNIILAVVFLVVFQFYIARPTKEIAGGLLQYDPNDEKQRAVRIPEYAEHVKDELGALSSTINQLFATNQKYLQEIEEMNATLEEKVKLRTKELQQSNEDLQATLNKLEKTQSQLVASEKLSALGEVVGGLAHEIQNPLNFINNFSEISLEMLEECQESLTTPDGQAVIDDERTADELQNLLGQVSLNSTKVHSYGQRVAKIVSCMLMHTTNEELLKAPMDLNVLARKYVGDSMRKMQKSHPEFTCEVVDDLAPNMVKCEVNDWAIGRVFINILDNAMYAMQYASKTYDDEHPRTLTLLSSFDEHTATVRFRDNGEGVPKELQQKIFQPFFTTSPIGIGVGLGLSVAHDFIAQHSGQMTVNSVAGEYAEFVVTIPLVAEEVVVVKND